MKEGVSIFINSAPEAPEGMVSLKSASRLRSAISK